MKTFRNQAAQGDIHFTRVRSLPKNANLVKVQPNDGQIIVTHSETGHHHVMVSDSVEMYRLPEELYECFLVVKTPTELKHLRPHDTHEPILFQPGTYRVRRQREYVPEGWRRVED